MQKKQYLAFFAFITLAIFLAAYGWEFHLSDNVGIDAALGTHDAGQSHAGYTRAMKWWHVTLAVTASLLVILVVSAVAWSHLTLRARTERALREANDRLERKFEARAADLKREIAKREHTQRQLFEREAQFRNVTDSSVRGLLIHNDKGILFANRQAACLLGYDAPDDITLLGDVNELVTPKDRKCFRRMLKEANRADSGSRHHEIKGRRKDGSTVWLSWTSRIFDWEGAPAHHTSFTDLTDRKNAEEALRASEARLAAILNLAPEGILSTDQNGIVQIFNEGAETIFGYRAEEVIGQPLDMLLPVDSREAHKRQIEDFNGAREAKREMCGHREAYGLRKDGTVFPAEASVSKIEINGAVAYSAIVRDATERRMAQQAMQSAKTEAELANRAKSSFLASMSHELRTPLNAIIGFSEIISKEMFGPVGNKTYHGYAKDILESGQHLLALINDVLDLSKVESGSVELWEEETEICTLVTTVTTMLASKAGAKNIRLVNDVQSDLPKLLADGRKLKQILANLISNAVKFTPQNGKVSTSARYGDKDGFVITVRDSGIGIAKEDIPKALSPFQQVDSDLNRKYEGTGLGLPLTLAFVALHGGTLDIESEPGAGTTVTVRLPASRAVIGAERSGSLAPPTKERRQFG